jgi:hypothetical protein
MSVSNQIDIEENAVLGNDFFQKMRVNICYESRMVNFKGTGE